MNNYLKSIDDSRFLHKNNEKIPSESRSMSLHIALEKADLNKDWNVFRELLKIEPIFLKKHLDSTSFIFDYNYLSLSKDEQYNLFN